MIKDFMFARSFERLFGDARIPSNLPIDLTPGKDRTLDYEGFRFIIHNDDHMPPHVHVQKGGIKGLFCIEEKHQDKNKPNFPLFDATFIIQVIRKNRSAFLQKWYIQNPETAKPRKSKRNQKKRNKRRDEMFIPLHFSSRRKGVFVMPIDNEDHDLNDYPRIRKWRRFDDINTVAVEFADGVLRLYPLKINEILHHHPGYGDYQEQCGKMFTTIRLKYQKIRLSEYGRNKKVSYFFKDWYFGFNNHWRIYLAEIYYYGISFDGFLSIDELTRDDVIRIASAEGLDLLSPPSYGPGGMTYKDYMMYHLKLDREYKAWVKAGRPQPDGDDEWA